MVCFSLLFQQTYILVSVYHYLEQHSWIDLRFSALGRIGAIQFLVVQVLKLGACQSDGCVLR